MSSSPLITPERGRRRRALAARRRRRRRVLWVGALAAAIAAALGVLALARPHNSRGSLSASRRVHRAAPVKPAAKPRSPDGLALGKPVFALTGVGAPATQPIHVVFHSPPRAGLLFDLDSGQVLWERNPHERLRIASLTKMMTALLTVQATSPRAPVLVTRRAVDSAGSKVGVLPLGRHVRVETMLYGLLLPSGNDAAVALAQHVAGSVRRFVARMNREAARLGMGCTRYSSPSGYLDRGNFSCAVDLAMLAHVDLAQPRIARIAHTYTAALPFPIKGGRLYLHNNNPLLIYHFPGSTGLKTGFTDAAGRCLVATARRHGVRLGVVLLNSSAPGVQASYLLDRGFRQVYRQPPVAAPPMPPGA
jgi:serine-type D-Ala-D-Ala carboxypeptidase (penicillin-binding protein 5/6)